MSREAAQVLQYLQPPGETLDDSVYCENMPMTLVNRACGGFSVLLSLCVLAGCHTNSAFLTNPPRSLTGRPSWFPLGGEVYQEKDVDEAARSTLEFEPQARWFLGFTQAGTTQQVNAYLEETGSARVTTQSSDYDNLIPSRPAYPQTLDDLPTSDRGVSVSLGCTTTIDPTLLRFSITMTSRSTSVWRQVEHRWTNVLPFLFAFYVDGKAVNIPSEGFAKFGGLQSFVILLQAGRTRIWSILVRQSSVNQFMPDGKPHTLSVVCAFSECQHEAWIEDRYPFLFFYRNTAPAKHLGPQVLVRSNVVRLNWNGTQWVVD